jgi:hypothetical protein
VPTVTRLLLAAGLLALALPSAPADEPGAVRLFNGKDLTHFYTFLKGEGKNADAKKVFTVVEEDGKPAIRVSGEVWGCFTTEKEYENYKLVVEFKWGDETFGERKARARDSGILVHATGADGAYGGTWMDSIEYQLIEGGTGDFIVVAAKKGQGPRLTAAVEERPTGPKGRMETYYKPGAPERVFRGGRVNWFARDPAWEDKLGFRGQHDVENPVGQWNTAEVICAGDTITNVLNGKVVNKATAVSPAKGKILFQSEGAEVFFRRIDLVPVGK